MIPVRQEWPAELAERYRRAGYWTGETLGGFLRTRADAMGDHTARISAEGRRWSYQELDAWVDRVAAGFLEAGFQPGDRVILQLPNIPEFLTTAFALLRVGILPVYALPAHRKAEITHFAAAAEAKGYVVTERHEGFDYRELVDEVRRELPGLNPFVVGDDPGPWTPYSVLEATDPSGTHDEPSPEAPAFFQLSGGSTGLSKLIPRTHADYVYTLRESARICGLGPSSVYLGVLPVAHNFPMSSRGCSGRCMQGARCR